MNDVLKFIKETKGFSGITMEGCYDLSIDFVNECYKMYKKTGKNYLKMAHDVIINSWSSDENYILTDQELPRVMIACNDNFIQEWLKPEIIDNCQKVINRTHNYIMERESYEGRKNEARNLLANKNFREKIFKKHGRKCRYCGTTKNLSIDHKISLYAGGSNEDDNFQVLCSSCNSSKGINVDKS